MLNQRLTLVLPAAAEDQDLFAARWLQEEVQGVTGLVLPLEKRTANNHPSAAIVLARADRDAAFLAQSVVPELPPQGYYLQVREEQVLLVGADAPGLFYAVQTLAQLVMQAGRILPLLTITDYPALAVRGVMLDVSRGKVPTLETVFEVVDLLARWKINQFQLYIEHAFYWPSHPQISKGYDPLTADDILAIDAACTQRHIEFVPNLQSFGHQGHLLRQRKYAHLAESEWKWTLAPTEPETYVLLDELYAEFLPNFRSGQMNVDSDETWDLGKGKSAATAAELGLGRVYLDHLLHLRELAADYGRRIMFWGDVILNSPELIPDLPADVTVLQWDYDETPNTDNVRKFADAGKPYYVCPSVHAFLAFFPRQRMARRNISALAAAAVQCGARGLLNTDWGDAGHSNLQGLSYYGYAFGAAESWRPGSTAQFDEAFGRLLFRDDGPGVMSVMHTLERIADPVEGISVWDFPVFHQGFLQGTDCREKLTARAAEVMRKAARSALAQLKPLRAHTRYPIMIEELWLAALQDNLLAEKVTLAVDFHQSYADLRARNDVGGLLALAREMRPRLRKLAKAIAEVPRAFSLLWLARSRESGLKEMIDYQQTVADDLRTTADWLKTTARTARHTGVVPSLPEKSEQWGPDYESPNGLITRK